MVFFLSYILFLDIFFVDVFGFCFLARFCSLLTPMTPNTLPFLFSPSHLLSPCLPSSLLPTYLPSFLASLLTYILSSSPHLNSPCISPYSLLSYLSPTFLPYSILSSFFSWIHIVVDTGDLLSVFWCPGKAAVHISPYTVQAGQ